jgi:hypothetical protein
MNLRDHQWLSGTRRFLALAVIYILLALLFTYPLLLNFDDHTPSGSASGDQCQTIWFFWWMQKALFDSHTNPYYTNAIYYPYGTYLGVHLCPLSNLLAIVVAGLFGVSINSPLVFNALLVLSFVLIGAGSYLLIRRVTGNPAAAFLASLFVAYSPYRLWHLDHLNLLSFGWAALAVVFAVRFLDKPRIGSLAAACLFAAAAFYAGLTNAMLAAVFMAVYVLVKLGEIRRHQERARLIAGVAIGIVATALLILPGLLNLQGGGTVWQIGWQDTERFSADLLNVFVPFPVGGGTGPGEVYLGWLLLLIAGGTVIFAWSPKLRDWLVMACVFLVLALGPTLQIGGHRSFVGLMPYRWLFDIVPYLNLSRSPVRFIVLAQFCLAVIAGHGIAVWLQALSRRLGIVWMRVGTGVVGAGITVLLLFEYTGGRIPLTEMTVPPVYQQVADDPAINVICNMPIADQLQIGNWYMYWQTFSGGKVVNGYLTRPSPGARRLLQQMEEWQDLGRDELQILHDNGVDAVVYHHPFEGARLLRLEGK